MSSIRIIQLSREKLEKGDGITINDIYEDPLFLDESDYGGELQTKENYVKSLKLLQNDIRPFARVNLRTRTIHMKAPEIVKRNYLRYVNGTMKEFKKEFSEGKYCNAEYTLRSRMRELTSSDLFHVGYCVKLSQVIADYLSGYLPATLYVGNILDAHC